MAEKPCRTCAMKSDAVNTREPHKCYEYDMPIHDLDGTCDEWRGSLRRNEPLNPPPMRKED